MRVTVVAGGIGGARFLLGLRALGHDITVVGNTGDDITLFGLRVCPDLDTVMYTLGGGISGERGWGREGETFRVRDELAAYGAGPAWFGLGDLDLAAHLLRTQWLREGVTLSEVTRRLCERWQPGVRLLPATDDTVETHVTLADGRTLHFQEWWVRLHAEVPARHIEQVGAASAAPAPGVVEAIDTADVVLFPPSNPVVSVGAVLSVPGIADAVRRTRAPVVGLSPIIGGAPVRGMADACLAAIGVETTAEAVARHYGQRKGQRKGQRGGPRTGHRTGPRNGHRRGGNGQRPAGLIDGWLVDDIDKECVDRLTDDGILARAVPLLMTSVDATAEMARAALDLAGEVARWRVD